MADEDVDNQTADGAAGDHRWLAANGMKAALDRHSNYGCLLAGALWLLLFVGVGLTIGSLGKMIWAPALAGLGIYASRKKAEKIFFNEIYCPRCGYNPTRRRSDGEPRKDVDKVLAQLRRYARCPECGAQD